MQIFVKTLTARLSPSRWSPRILLTTSSPRSRTRRASHPTSNVSSSLASNSRMPHPFGLQHPEGVHSSSSAPSPWRCKEAQEEGVHHPKEDQAQAQEDQVGCPQ